MYLIKRTLVAGLVAGLLALVTVFASSSPALAGTTQHARVAAPPDSGLEGSVVPAQVQGQGLFPCDWLTHVCYKFNKADTKWVAAHTSSLSGGGIGGAGALCGKIPGIGAVACVLAVEVAGGALADSFNNAAAKGQCVELHFSISLLALTHWKTEGC